MSKIEALTFEKLFDYIEENKIKTETYKSIAQIIYDAERDWRIPIKNLEDLNTILEKEINGKTTKNNLEKLLKKYNKDLAKYAWESESVSVLLGIFILTDKTNLKEIFNDLIENIITH